MKYCRHMADLSPGDRAVVTDICMNTDMRRRLQDMGLIEGTLVECVGISPLGDPCAYLISRTVIALRKEDASQVRIRLVA